MGSDKSVYKCQQINIFFTSFVLLPRVLLSSCLHFSSSYILIFLTSLSSSHLISSHLPSLSLFAISLTSLLIIVLLSLRLLSSSLLSSSHLSSPHLSSPLLISPLLSSSHLILHILSFSFSFPLLF